MYKIIKSLHHKVYCIIVLSLGFSLPTQTYAELYFDVDALNLTDEQKKQLDLTELERADTRIPGEYEVKITINDADVGNEKLNFVICNTKLCPELFPSLLEKWGVKLSSFSELKSLSPTEKITDLAKYLPQSTVNFNQAKQSLVIMVPQAAMVRQARGYVAPDRWDDGVPAAFVSYSSSGYETNNHLTDKHTSSQYLNLRSGVNLGAWRLRNYSYYSHSKSEYNKWKSLQTWIERDIRPLRSSFLLGETSTPGLIFDSFNFGGAYIASQDAMLPDSMKGYAPEIRGVALTNATVEVRQNGNLLYQTFVTPGEFIINDLYATSTSGDLEIIIREQDGTVRTYTQSYASPPIAVRKGIFKYSATLGKYGNHNSLSSNINKQHFIQTEFLYGLLDDTSIYGGIIASNHYRSGVIGLGQGLGQFGGLSFDVTHAETEFSDNQKRTGQAYQLRYSKNINTTNTMLSLTNNYYTDGYYDFSDANNGYYYTDTASKTALKNRIQLTINQNIGMLGTFALSAYQENYWNNPNNKTRYFTGSWSKTINGIGISLNQSQSRNWQTGKKDNITSLNVSIPLGAWLSTPSLSSLQMSNHYSQSNQGNKNWNATVSGNMPIHNGEFSYTLAQAWNKQKDTDGESNSAINGTYKSGQFSASLGYANYYGHNNRINWGLNGAIVAHPYGVTLSQQLSSNSAYAIIKAENASDVKIKNKTGLSTDWRGYAIVPYMNAYHENQIALDSASLGDDVDLSQSPIKKVVPTRGAFVLADYDIRIGLRVFLTLTYQGKPLPFATPIVVGDTMSLTDENGQVYLAGLEDNTNIVATLPGGQSCKALFDEKQAIKQNGIFISSLECH